MLFFLLKKELKTKLKLLKTILDAINEKCIIKILKTTTVVMHIILRSNILTCMSVYYVVRLYIIVDNRIFKKSFLVYFYSAESKPYTIDHTYIKFCFSLILTIQNESAYLDKYRVG